MLFSCSGTIKTAAYTLSENWVLFCFVCILFLFYFSKSHFLFYISKCQTPLEESLWNGARGNKAAMGVQSACISSDLHPGPSHGGKHSPANQ